jgi:predicted AAA+ superfamily ATPase
MALTPWYKNATPREDLRKRAPLDAAQFAVHLDQVFAGDAPPEYSDAERFLARTFITEGLRRFASEGIRRLAGERQGANAVLNLTTQFGGGKTHALTLLYHLTRLGPAASDLIGVRDLLDHARVDAVPEAAAAVFVGTSWSAVSGRGGGGEPLRRTPWGEIAWQLSEQTGRPELFEAVRAEDEAQVAPGEDVIARFIPADHSVLILMDETMAFVTKARAIRVGESTLASQFYEFIRELTGFADGRDRLVVVVSLPKSEEEMSAEDE